MKSAFIGALVGVVAVAISCSAIADGTPARSDSWISFGYTDDPLVASDVNEGAAASGFLLTSTVRQPALPAGNSVVLDIAVTNVTDEVLLYVHDYPEAEFDLRIQEPSGGVRKKGRSLESHGLMVRQLQPGERFVRTYRVPKEWTAAPGGYQLTVRAHLFRLDGEGHVTIPSSPMTVLVSNQTTAAQEPPCQEVAVVEERQKGHISPPLVEARGILEKAGLSISWADAKQAVVKRRGHTAAIIQPGSALLQFGNWKLSMGRKAEIRNGRLFVPGHILSFVRTYGG